MKFLKQNPKVLRDRSVKLCIDFLRTVFIITLSYLFVYPLLFMVCTAFQDPTSVNDPSVILFPKKWSLESVKEMIEVLRYWDSAWLTLIIAVTSTLASLVSCSLVGYGLSRYKFKGQNLIFMLVVLTIIVPPQTILPSKLLNFQFFDFGGLLSLIPGKPSVNLLNTVWTFVLPSLFATGLRSGLFIYIFKQFFSGLPKELEEAARIDGCSAMQTYVRIIIPLAVPAFITVTLFSFIWHWNDLYSSSMFFTNDVKPLMPLLNSLDTLLERSSIGSSAYVARTYKASATLLTILPPLILYIFTQKYFTESIERSGIVG
ncbi:MAG: carbohydrate ABC transporter permease [Clostridia bacterium]|nr:carbohydrate ABC transporter permease [Clostridia bacterium]